MKRSLLLTHDFPPVISGISTVFYHIWKHYSQDRYMVLTRRVEGFKTFDRTAAFRPRRIRAPKTGKPGKIITFFLMAFWTTYYVLFRSVREIHAGQILSCGPIGYLFQKLFGIPWFLWVYGGETSAAYRRSKWEEKLVNILLRECTYIVTNSSVVTREFVDYGISEKRIIEIVPAVDADIFTPGPPPANLIEKLGLEGKQVLLTVARLTKRKGHDLVLKAMDMLRNRDNLRYVIVGSGEDRERLEGLVETLGLTGSVICAGRVEDSELPDYYRLCDIYVMPNREVLESTDSIEGFGISFIEANACEKPCIGGRSGGAEAAVVDGVTGYLINPENAEELAEKICFLLDNPDVSADMGRAGRMRVLREFSWETRAHTLAGYFTVPVEVGQ